MPRMSRVTTSSVTATASSTGLSEVASRCPVRSSRPSPACTRMSNVVSTGLGPTMIQAPSASVISLTREAINRSASSGEAAPSRLARTSEMAVVHCRRTSASA
jgi:hypothetical protein